MYALEHYRSFAHVVIVVSPPQSSAKEAVMKLDNHQLGLKRLKVAISNPPKRSAAATIYPTEGGTPINKPGGPWRQ